MKALILKAIYIVVSIPTFTLGFFGGWFIDNLSAGKQGYEFFVTWLLRK